MFHSGDLQSGIALAVQQRKAVLCFVCDSSDQSTEWEDALTQGPIRQNIDTQAVALKIEAGSEEAGFLSPICPINSTPAVIVIKDAALQANLQAAQIETTDLTVRLAAIFGSASEDAPLSASGEAESTIQAQGPAEEATGETGSWPPPPASTPSPGYLVLPNSEGQFRLPNNAYDALRQHTDQLVSSQTPPPEIYQAQLRLLERLPILRQEVQRLRSSTSSMPVLSDYARDKLLRMPAAAIKAQAQAESAAASSASSTSTEPQAQQAASARPNRGGEYVYIQPDSAELQSEAEHSEQRKAEAAKKRKEAALWTRMQRERQQKDREARERVKAQIAADREERRRLSEFYTQNERIAEAEAEAALTKERASRPSDPVRLQVRTFDGSTLKSNAFQHGSSLSNDVRPWIDSQIEGKVPYNLKLILTPLPNRTIEAAEEEKPLSDLGIHGSATLVMVPVKGYVESYTGTPSSGLIGSAFSGGYNLITGAAGTLVGGMKYVLGYGDGSGNQDAAASAHEQGNSANPSNPTTVGRMKIRTLADQRVEQMDRRGPNSQLYNGNQLNFEPNRDEDEDQKKD